MSKQKVSACIITYNQESFIEDCLIGAINQNVNFNYEIVIGDDCSTDKTQEICLEYQAKFPNWIKYIRRSENLGMIGNWIATINECEGDYIALCDGDDYWTDPLKLPKQVKASESNEFFSLVTSQSNVYDNVKRSSISTLPHLKFGVFGLKEYLTNNLGVLPICTFLFRKEYIVINEFIECTRNCFFVDGILVALLLKNEKNALILPEVTASYRVNTGTSITTNKSNLFFIKSWFQTIKQSAAFFNSSEQKIIKKHISIQHQRLAAEYLKIKNIPRAILSMFCGLKSINIFNLSDLKDFYWRFFIY
jgi:glycosyltransferase involved in cell wall biosynthesis